MPKKARVQFPTKLTDIEKLATFLCVPISDLNKLQEDLKNSPWRVARTFKKKQRKKTKNGWREKEREMSEVYPRYKSIYSILNRRFQQIELPPNIFGSAKGRSQRQNAARHVGHKHVYQIDIKNYFPSLKFKHIKALFVKLGAAPKVASFLAKLVLFENSLPYRNLPQGFAPSSSIANLFVCVFVYEPFIRKLPGKYMFSSLLDDVSLSSFDPIEEEDKKFLCSLIEAQGLGIHTEKIEDHSPRESKMITGYRVGMKIHASKDIIACVETNLNFLKTKSPAEIAVWQGPLYWEDGLKKAVNKKQDLGDRYINHVKGKIGQIFAFDPKAAQRIHRRYKWVLWEYELVSTKQLKKAGIISD